VNADLRARLVRTGVGVGALGAAAALLLAGATIWLVLTDPVVVTDALAAREASGLLAAVAGVLLDAIRSLARWL
jgi:hypothetical protein